MVFQDFFLVAYLTVLVFVFNTGTSSSAVKLRYSYTLQCEELQTAVWREGPETPKLRVHLDDGRQVECGTQSFDAGYEVIPEEPTEEFFDPLGTGNREWRLAFRGTPYVGYSVFDAYMNGAGIPSNLERGCKQIHSSSLCSNHYRNNAVLDNWENNIDQVLFAIYKNNAVVHHLIFNGSGSTFSNWFAPTRLLSTTWVDLAGSQMNYFSITGDARASPPAIYRRFFINKSYGSCPGDTGWFVVADIINPPCPWEKVRINTFPVFKYSPEVSFINWTNDSPDLAEAFGVFVKYRAI